MSWSLADLMPICPIPTCPHYGTRHLMQHQQEAATTIFQCNENYIYLQGGVGSAKSILFGAITAALAIMIPNSKGILFRISFELNHDTLWGYFCRSIEAALEQNIIQGRLKDIFKVRKAGKPTVCQLPNGAEYKAAETANWRRAIGPTYDVITISDAMENNGVGSPRFIDLFNGEGTVGGLKSRLRGQPSSFYRLADGNYRDMRRFLVESNPPPDICDIHEVFGTAPGVRTFTDSDIKYRYIQMSTAQNDHNPPTYVAEQAVGHSEEDLQRILLGETVPYYGGKKVIPEFNEKYHVNDFEVDLDLPLLVSIDGGLQHPAVLVSQIKRCSYDREHYIRLSEISNLYDVTAHQLASLDVGIRLGILAHLGLFYPSFFDYAGYLKERQSLLKNGDEDELITGAYSYLEPYFSRIRFCIDKSQDRRSSTNKDKSSDRLILLRHYGIRCKYRTGIGLDQSLTRVRRSFEKLCVCDVPEQLIDRQCKLLINAYKGGYRYAKNTDGTHKDVPLEDHKNEDVADADRYGLENFLWLSGYAGKELEEAPVMVDRYSWMITGHSEARGLQGAIDR